MSAVFCVFYMCCCDQLSWFSVALLRGIKLFDVASVILLNITYYNSRIIATKIGFFFMWNFAYPSFDLCTRSDNLVVCSFSVSACFNPFEIFYLALPKLLLIVCTLIRQSLVMLKNNTSKIQTDKKIISKTKQTSFSTLAKLTVHWKWMCNAYSRYNKYYAL